jgi:predicted O-methyltransferase YrrM
MTTTQTSTLAPNRLTQAPLAPLLDRLFAEAKETDAVLPERLGAVTPGELAALHADYPALYRRANDLFLPVSRDTGKLLYLLARATRARSILEFGTSFGISTLHLAAAIADNGGGQLIGTEFEPTKLERAERHLQEAGLASFVDLRGGDALESLSRDLPASIDLVLLDGAKILYPRILDLVEPRLRTGALVVADNVEASPVYLERVRRSGAFLSLPFGDDVEVSCFVGA